MGNPKPRFSLWVAVFAITSALQVFRGAALDEAFFFSGTAALVAATWLTKEYPAGKRFEKMARFARHIALFIIVVLSVLPRHSIAMLVVLLVMLPFLLVAAWIGPYHPAKEPSKRINYTRHLWTAWAVIFCVWEFAANILGQLVGNLTSFPTISILLDPFIDTRVGKLVFVSLWVWAGYVLLFRLREKKS